MPYKFKGSRNKTSGTAQKKVKRVRWITPRVDGNEALATLLAECSDAGMFIKDVLACGATEFTVIACKTEYVIEETPAVARAADGEEQ